MSAKTISASVLEFRPEIAERFEELGIGVELSEFSMPENLGDSLEKRLYRNHEVLKNFKGPVSMHGAFYNMQLMVRDPWLVQVCFKRMQQSLNIADAMGARKVVFHANYSPNSRPGYKEMFINTHIDFWGRLLDLAEKHDIQMLLENTQEPDASYIADILTAIDSPYLKACLDTGHTHCFTNSNIPLEQWVEGFGNQLAYVHLHANNGVRDEHLAYTDGNQDFSKFFPALDALDEFPHIIIEVKTREAFNRSVEALKGRGWL